MDQTEIVAYKRFWRDVLIGPPAQTADRGMRPASLGQVGASRTRHNSKRKEGARQKAISLFPEKTCPNNGGKLSLPERHAAKLIPASERPDPDLAAVPANAFAELVSGDVFHQLRENRRADVHGRVPSVFSQEYHARQAY
jgi:hypothetical protein